MRTRALQQSLYGIKAVGGLGIGAIVMFLVYSISNPYLSDARANAPGGYGGVTMNTWLNTGLDKILPATFLLLVLFGLVARAVITRSY